jgi:hypothetical protein
MAFFIVTAVDTSNHAHNNLSDSFPIQNGIKEGDAASLLLFNFALGYAIKKVRTRWG